MMTQRICGLILGAVLGVTTTIGPAAAAERNVVRNIVLVHGAWADGSSWAKVIPLLEKAGLNAVAVQNPLTSFDDDVAATKRAIALQDGPVILVGHSWGGAVITESIFAWPGLGQLTIAAISQRDLPLIQGIVLTFAIVFALVNLVVDLLYAAVDPRIRLG